MYRRAFLGAAASLAALSAEAQESRPVQVGAVQILSGPIAAPGISIRDGLVLALEDVNAGVGRKVALTVEDSAGSKEQAINVVRKLIGRDKVVAIIGPTLSEEMFAAGPIANERKIPIIGTSTTAVGITGIGPYVFRTSLPESDVVPVTLAYAKAHGVKSIALLYGNDSLFSKSGFDVMKAAAERIGLNILAVESFASRDADFSAQLTRIKALHPNAIGISAFPEPMTGVLLTARQLGFGKEALFIGGNSANTPKVGEIAGSAADGLIVGSPWFVGKDDPVNQAFVAKFRARYNKDPDQFSAQAYDCMHILATAMNKAGAAEPERIRDALLLTNYNGVMGPFTFTPGRDPASTEGVVVLAMQDGKFGIAPG